MTQKHYIERLLPVYIKAIQKDASRMPDPGYFKRTGTLLTAYGNPALYKSLKTTIGFKTLSTLHRALIKSNSGYLKHYKTAFAKENLPFQRGSKGSFTGRMEQNNNNRNTKAHHSDARKIQEANYNR